MPERMRKQHILYLVVPCYNEETILSECMERLYAVFLPLLEQYDLSPASRILLVDDGSKDKTWEIIGALADGKRHFAGLKLSRNFGHQGALLAGLMHAKDLADCTISLDADLQDDISVLADFLKEYTLGADVVYGVRSDRSTDTWFKRTTALMFYHLMEWLGGKVVKNHADYRLLSKRALEALAEFREVNLYLRGIIPLIGFRQAIVLYKRQATDRKTHYPLAKMLLLAWDGITSFSIRPIRLITLLGFLMLVFSLAMLLYFLYLKYFGTTVQGWTSLIFVSMLLGGVQLFCMGIIGEYTGKIYTEVKHRPRYIEDTGKE